MRAVVVVSIIASTGALAQTPPIKPDTPDVKVPRPIEIPLPPEMAGAKPLSEDEALALARERNRRLAAARAAVESATGRTRQAQSALLPQIGLNASASEQDQIRGSAGGGQSGFGSNRFNIGLSVDQLLFDFGRTRNQVRQQAALERASRHELSQAEQALDMDVRLAFHGLVEANRLVRASEQNVSNRQRQLAQAEARVESGLGAPADFVRAKTNLADAVLALETARASALNARFQLAEQLGVDPRTPITPTETQGPPTMEPLDLADLVGDALRRRPEITVAQQRVLAAGLGVAVARLSNAPRLSASAGLNARGSEDPLGAQTASLGVVLSWSFGDGGLAAGRTQEARANEEAARANLELVSQSVVAEVSQAYVDLLTAYQRLETSNVQLANARELLRISEGRYQGGIGQFLEVTDAQTSLFTAERNVTQAQADVGRARARLARATGGASLALAPSLKDEPR
ncbi:MAG TPA: TolC family protein [Fimbriimonadaceae bacterium]|nr:TolC family protein [Fimbriimonadaceae bacterium]